MTLPFAPVTDRCEHCPSSQEGCVARQQFAKGERCCVRCTHGDPDDADLVRIGGVTRPLARAETPRWVRFSPHHP